MVVFGMPNSIDWSRLNRTDLTINYFVYVWYALTELNNLWFKKKKTNNKPAKNLDLLIRDLSLFLSQP
jgi:hypothetical protein